MINDNDNKIDIENENPNIENFKKEKEFYLNGLKEKYNNIMKNDSKNNYIKEINCLNNLLENSFAIDKFKKYINNDFLDNCEYKLVFMPDEFNMKEDKNYYFAGFGDKKRRKGNFRNKNNIHKNAISDAKKNKKKY